MTKYTIELSQKDAFLLWCVACMFRKPVTSDLKSRLAKIAMVDEKKQKLLEYYYAKDLEDRVIEYGKWLEEYRAKEVEKNV